MNLNLGLAFQVIENEDFRNLLNFVSESNVDFKLPNRRSIRDYATSLQKEVDAKVKRQMSKATSISLTTDCWTSTRQKMGFLGITAHFMNSKLVMKTACICFKRLVGSHTGHRIAELIHDVLEAFDITKKVNYITTDNGVNIVSAV